MKIDEKTYQQYTERIQRGEFLPDSVETKYSNTIDTLDSKEEQLQQLMRQALELAQEMTEETKQLNNVAIEQMSEAIKRNDREGFTMWDASVRCITKRHNKAANIFRDIMTAYNH